MMRLGGCKAIYVALVALAMALLPAAPSIAATAHRLALVIGNNAYTDGVLKNPINDARSMAATLRDLGFEVRVLENADRMAMQRAVVEFGRKLNENTVGLFYFAGHGMQVRGANYLIPVKAEITSEEEVEVEGLDVAYVMARMATARNQFNIVILDACRNNPFQRSFRSTSNGLAAISAPTGTLIAYATAPGSVASDGDSANGIYTSELVKAIRQPGVSMEEAFKQARSGVIQRTQGRQTPWESSSVVGNFMFRAAPAQVASLAAPVAPPKDSAAEIAFWNTIKDSQDLRDFQAYLDSYPNGTFDRLARIRVAALGESGKTRAAPVPAVPGKATPAPAPVAKKDTAVASLTAPAANLNAATTPASDYEAMLQQNWPKVEAALKTHMQTEFATYRVLMPSGQHTTSMPINLKLTKASLQSVDAAARQATILLTGQRQDTSSWAAFNAPFSYVLDLVDGRVVIGEYHYNP